MSLESKFIRKIFWPKMEDMSTRFNVFITKLSNLKFLQNYSF